MKQVDDHVQCVMCGEEASRSHERLPGGLWFPKNGSVCSKCHTHALTAQRPAVAKSREGTYAPCERAGLLLLHCCLVCCKYTWVQTKMVTSPLGCPQRALEVAMHVGKTSAAPSAGSWTHAQQRHAAAALRWVASQSFGDRVGCWRWPGPCGRGRSRPCRQPPVCDAHPACG